MSVGLISSILTRKHRCEPRHHRRGNAVHTGSIVCGCLTWCGWVLSFGGLQAKCSATPGCKAYVWEPNTAACGHPGGNSTCWIKGPLTGPVSPGRPCRTSQLMPRMGPSVPLLNGKYTFLTGTLDQSWWPDGLCVPLELLLFFLYFFFHYPGFAFFPLCGLVALLPSFLRPPPCAAVYRVFWVMMFSAHIVPIGHPFGVDWVGCVVLQLHRAERRGTGVRPDRDQEGRLQCDQAPPEGQPRAVVLSRRPPRPGGAPGRPREVRRPHIVWSGDRAAASVSPLSHPARTVMTPRVLGDDARRAP